MNKSSANPCENCASFAECKRSRLLRLASRSLGFAYDHIRTPLDARPCCRPRPTWTRPPTASPASLSHAAPHSPRSRRVARRAGASQARDPAAHRLVQIPRRLQRACAIAPEQANGAWWPIPPAITPRASPLRRALGSGDDRDAARCAAEQARAHRGARCRGRALRPRQRGSRSDRPRTSPKQRGAVSCRLSTIRWSSPGRGPPAGRSASTWTALGCLPDVVLVGASGGGLIAGIALAMKALVPGARLFVGAGGLRRPRPSFSCGKRETNAHATGSSAMR